MIQWTVFLLMQLTLTGLGSADLIGSLQQVPNPFRLATGTLIHYELLAPVDIQLVVYDDFGQRMMTSSFPAGTPGGKQDNNYVHLSQSDFNHQPLKKGCETT